jgi:hypothetical protein
MSAPSVVASQLVAAARRPVVITPAPAQTATKPLPAGFASHEAYEAYRRKAWEQYYAQQQQVENASKRQRR